MNRIQDKKGNALTFTACRETDRRNVFYNYYQNVVSLNESIHNVSMITSSCILSRMQAHRVTQLILKTRSPSCQLSYPYDWRGSKFKRLSN